ncbi:hypothetical protein [Streptomyces sp. 8N706]|uniref:hypothetical protein n=1 Tax=Streptomyces sp. 8N706 TaxID=3457416 RepID=UPI003FD1B1A4
MSRFRIYPDKDPEPAAVLHLSRLGHVFLYSDAELRRAIAEPSGELDAPGTLLSRCTDSLLRSRAAGESTRQARRTWALRMTADLTRDGADAGTGRRPGSFVRRTTDLKRAS